MSECRLAISELWLLITVALSTTANGTKVERCKMEPYGSSSYELSVDCRNRMLNTIPKYFYNKSVVDLDLSGNHFTNLMPLAFHGLSSLRKLNISMCDIQSISNSSFDGLRLLEELDMKNNPVIGSDLPEGLFNALPRLRRLFVSGHVTNTSAMRRWGQLDNLTEIILTPGHRDSFRFLTALPKLVKVYFAFCRFGSVLGPSMLEAFRNSTIKELAFIGCALNSIRNGTFSGLASLETLNLAGNDQLSLNHVIDALSTSSDVTVKTLIADGVGAASSLFIAGLHEPAGGCRPALKHLTSLSVRGTNIVAVTARFQNCLPNLQAIAFGFNTIAKCGRSPTECLSIIFKTLLHLRYVDMSYFMLSDTPGLAVLSGHKQSLNWIKLNEDYLPSLSQYTSQTCDVQGQETLTDVAVNSNCSWIPLPVCLAYLKADHWFRNLFIPIRHRKCVQFPNNSLQYLNISSRFSAARLAIALNRTIYGLTSLRVLDASGFGLIFIDFDDFRNSPSLEVLNLAGNVLGRNRLSCFPVLPRLTELNLASNQIRRFPAGMFRKLSALRHLDLSNNQLTSVQFGLPANLERLDLSGNLLTSFGGDARALMDGLPRLLLLQIDNNPFQCDCPETDFVIWYKKTTTNISRHPAITCQQGISTYRILDLNTDKLQLRCGLTVNRIVMAAVLTGVVITLITVGCILYRYRWKIKWQFYKLRYLRQRRRDDMLLRDLNAELQHSAYVIYPSDEDRVSEWVFASLVAGVEGNLQKPPMFVRGRDDSGGSTVIDEIVRGIMRSQTAIWIICPAFFQDHHCEVAANFAFHQLGPQNNLLVILENRFEKYSVPRNFASLMHPDIGLDRVRYADNKDVKSLFWAKLDQFLPAWSPLSVN